MIEKINESALASASEKSFRVAVIRKINQICDAVNTGVVWENQVKAERGISQVYKDLPLSVIAEMVDEEVATCEHELFGGTENE